MYSFVITVILTLGLEPLCKKVLNFDIVLIITFFEVDTKISY